MESTAWGFIFGCILMAILSAMAFKGAALCEKEAVNRGYAVHSLEGGAIIWKENRESR